MARRWAFGAYAAALTAALLLPMGGRWTRTAETAVEGCSLLLHVGAFAGLALLAAPARLPRGRASLAAGLAAYAVLTEAAQALVPSRHFNGSDIAANLLGVAVGLAAAWLVSRVHWRRTREGPAARCAEAAKG